MLNYFSVVSCFVSHSLKPLLKATGKTRFFCTFSYETTVNQSVFTAGIEALVFFLSVPLCVFWGLYFSR